MQNLAVYYRVSTDKQDIDSQRVAIEQWLNALQEHKKPKNIYFYQDEGISGKTLNRPGLNQMLKAAYAGKLDTIVVYRLDRFSRHASSAIRLILTLDEAGVAFISVTQPVLNLGHENPFRRTMLAAFAEIAELERETIVARVQAGLQAARKRGVRLGAPPKITAEIKEQAMVLRAAGHNLRSISKTLQISLGSLSKLFQGT